MRELGPILKKLLKDYDLWQSYQHYLLIDSWHAIVGANLAEVSQAESLNKGVLVVCVKDSVWSYHLSMLKPQLLSKLNDFAGTRMVRDIHFRIGELKKEDQ